MESLGPENRKRWIGGWLLGGGSAAERSATIALVAKYGDACNLFELGGMEALTHKLEVLREHCAAEGRPYQEIEKTTYGQLTDTESAEQLLERFGRLAEAGIDHAIDGAARPVAGGFPRAPGGGRGRCPRSSPGGCRSCARRP